MSTPTTYDDTRERPGRGRARRGRHPVAARRRHSSRRRRGGEAGHRTASSGDAGRRPTVSAERVETVLCLDDWTHPADEDDQAMLALCEGPTLDVGCGPGRLTEALVERGHVVLGIDVARDAVGRTLDAGRGGHPSRRVLAAPRRGPVVHRPARRRQRRHRRRPGGAAAPARPSCSTRAAGSWSSWPHPARRSAPAGPRCAAGTWSAAAFRWSVVGVDVIDAVAKDAGFEAAMTHRFGDRWCAVLEAPR